jgi:hypothetical protein
MIRYFIVQALLGDALERFGGEGLGLVPGHCHQSALGRLLELAVAGALADLLPAVGFD